MRSELACSVMLALIMAGNVYAADISVCPKVADIKSSAYKDPQIPAPYNEGFKYEAPSATGKKWQGETMPTGDDFLDKKYALKAESVADKTTKTTCSYGGTAITNSNGETSMPYLKMILDK